MKTIVTIAAALTVLFVIACGGGNNAVQICKDLGTAECQKMWTCDAGVKLGKDQADCVSSYGALCGLMSSGTCPSGAAFDATHAQACITDTTNATCGDYSAGTYRAANCDAAKCK